MALVDLSLLELVPAISPEMQMPLHLLQWCAVIEKAGVERVRAMCAVPTRHWKTRTTLHGVVWLLLRHPDWRILLIAHDHVRAEWMGKQVKRLRDRAVACGAIELTPAPGQDTIRYWSNERGGGVTVISADQSALGYDANVVIADDPITELGFRDINVRDSVDNMLAFYASRAGGAGNLGSVLLVMSRGDVDDPIGRRLARKAVDWEYIFSPAILDEDQPTERAFAPDVWDLPALKANRAEMQEIDPSLRVWRSQWQNDPTANVDGGFGLPVRGPAPEHGYYVGGLDLAYSDHRASDYFAMVVARVWERKAYVVNVWREKRDLALAAKRIEDARRLYPGVALFTYISGPEKGAVNYLADKGLQVSPMHARTPKYNRAQQTKDAWNAGRIVLPDQASWVGGFILRAQRFTGNEADGDDDEIDALVSMWDGGVANAGVTPKAIGARRRV